MQGVIASAECAGLRIRYTQWGSGGEVILLLHDTAEAGMLWASVAQRLADLGYRVLAPDMRGMLRPKFQDCLVPGDCGHKLSSFAYIIPEACD